MRLSDKNIELILADSRECRAPGMGDVQLLCAEIQERRKNGEDYKLHYNSNYGGHFHKVGCWEFEQPVVTKVVKFLNPRPERPGYHRLNHYVVIESTEPLTDEDACERAIDVVLGLGAGFDGTNAHPALVI